MRLRTGPETKITCDLVIRCGNAVSMMEVAPAHAFGLLQRPLKEWGQFKKGEEVWSPVGGALTYDLMIRAMLELQAESDDVKQNAHWAGIYFDVTDKQYNAQFHMDDTRVAFDAYAEVHTTHLAKKLSRTLKVLGISLDKAVKKDGQLAE